MSQLAGRLGLSAVAIVFAAALWYGARALHQPAPDPMTPDTVYLQASARAGATAETTFKIITRFRTRVDSIFPVLTIHDTTFIRELDTVLVQCERCAAELRAFRHRCDSMRTADADTIARLRTELRKAKGQRSWWALGGLIAGSASCRVR